MNNDLNKLKIDIANLESKIQEVNKSDNAVFLDAEEEYTVDLFKRIRFNSNEIEYILNNYVQDKNKFKKKK